MADDQDDPASALTTWSGGASECVTDGVRVRVRSQFLPEHSSPAERRWAFSYTIVIANEGDAPATLLARHWLITDGAGREEHVRGPGVVGRQPQLKAGQSFTYTSGAVLRTPHGTMEGEYLMERDGGVRFEAAIAPFALVTPESVN